MERLRSPEYQHRVRELLNELEELEPRLSRSPREIFLSKFRNIMALVALISFLLSGIALVRVGVLDRNVSNEARTQAVHSKEIADCINTVLGTRNAASTRETAARKQYAEDQKAFAESVRIYAHEQGAVFSAAISGSKDKNLGPRLVKAQADFEVASDQFEQDSNTFVDELNAVQKMRDDHPLGKC